MPHNVSAVDKFNRYVTMHPKECMGKSAYEICTSILNMSQKELQEIENNHFLIPFQYSAKQAPTPYAGFKSPVEKMIHKPAKAKQPAKSTGKKYHPQATFAEVDDNGKIKPQQFSFEAIKKKYNSKNYKITRNPKNGFIEVKKKNGDLVLKVSTALNNKIYMVTCGNNSQTDRVTFDSTGAVWEFQHRTKTANDYKAVIYKNGSKTPTRTVKMNKDGTQETIYDKNGQLSQVNYYNRQNDKDNPNMSKFYSAGKLYKIQRGGEREYPIIKELAQIIGNGKSMTPQNVTKLSDTILKRLNSENGDEIAKMFNYFMGDNLDGVIKSLPLSNSIKDKLLAHVYSVSGSSLGEAMFHDVDGLGSGDLEKHMKYLNVNNIKEVLSSFRKTNYEYNTQGRMRMFRSYEGLLKAISEEYGLGDKRYKMINQIINTALQNCAPNTKKNALEEIKKHPKDYQKIEVDLYRAMNVEFGKLSDKNIDRPADTSNNKTFNGPIIQGKLGDCWLLSGINSALAKPKARQKLEQQVQYDKRKDMYYVTFKGLNRVYTVKGNELKNKSYISAGSTKVKAIEVALDSYKKEKAYKNEKLKPYIYGFGSTFDDVDIVGGYAMSFWKDMFGNTKDNMSEKIDCMKENFSDGNKLYSMFLNNDPDKPDRKISGLAKTTKDEDYTFESNHELAILGSDKNNIYLSDPNDTSYKIIVSRANFKKINAHISRYTMA